MKTSRLMLSAACAALIVGAAQTAAAETTFTAVKHSALRTLDPVLTTALITQNHAWLIYDQLLGLDEKYEVQPQMAESFSVSDDKLTYTFKLREGLAFSDGDPVTSEDVIASIKRWGARDSMGQKMMTAVKEFRVLDDRSFEMVMREPYGLTLPTLAKSGANTLYIMKAEIAATPPTEAIKEHIGSGPFIFAQDEFQPGVKTVYLKNPNYKGRSEPPSGTSGDKTAKVDRQEWIVMPDHMTTINAMLGGEIDYIESVPHDLAPLLKDQPGITIRTNNPLGWQGHMRFNALHPPLDDPKLRRAILTAIKQSDYMQAMVGDPSIYKLCKALFVCGTPLETTVGSDGLLEGDLEAAKKLVAEAGYDGTPIVILHPTDLSSIAPYGPLTAQTLRAIGLEVDLQAMDWNTVVSRRAKQDPPAQGGWNMFHTNWGAETMMNPVSNPAVGGMGPNGGWFGWPTDAELEDLRTQFAFEGDPEKQIEIAEKIQKRAYELALYAPLGQYFPRIAYRDHVKGILYGPGTWLWNIEIDESAKR